MLGTLAEAQESAKAVPRLRQLLGHQCGTGEDPFLLGSLCNRWSCDPGKAPVVFLLLLARKEHYEQKSGTAAVTRVYTITVTKYVAEPAFVFQKM